MDIREKYKYCVKKDEQGNIVSLTYADMLRIERKPLLQSFDIYKANVNYGVVVEGSERHAVISKWYQDILNITTTLDESLITNHPVELDKYL